MGGRGSTCRLSFVSLQRSSLSLLVAQNNLFPFSLCTVVGVGLLLSEEKLRNFFIRLFASHRLPSLLLYDDMIFILNRKINKNMRSSCGGFVPKESSLSR